MALATNIVRRRAIYYVRAAVPLHLIDRFGRRELWRSLKTSNATVARSRASSCIATLRGLFEKVAADMAMTREQIDEAVRRFYARELVVDEAERRGPVPFDRGSYEIKLDMLRRLEAELVDHLARGEFALVQDFADEAIDPYGVATLGTNLERQLNVDRSSPAYRELCQKLLRARLEATRRQIERHQGDWAGAAADPLLAAPMSSEPVSAETAVLPAPANVNLPAAPLPDLPALPKLVEDFLASKLREGVKAKSVAEMRTALDWFVAYIGKQRHVASVTRKDLIAYRDDLLNLPAYWEDRCKGMTIRQACEHGRTSNLPKLDLGALKAKRLGPVKQFWAWLAEREPDHFPVDPAREVTIKVQRNKRSKRDAFTVDQLNSIFRAPIYTGAASESRWKDPGPVLIRDHRYWAPLLALFSGCRRAEVCQLLVRDVVTRDGVACLSINEHLEADEQEALGKSTKNEFSVREVPLHPQLVELGFLDHVERRRKAGKRRLFDVDQARSYDAYGKFFGRFLDSLKLSSPRLVFHSLRHNFEQAMLDAIPDYALRWQLGGRTDDHSSAEYRGKGYSIARRAEAIAKIEYVGLDLTHLRKLLPLPVMPAKNTNKQ